MRFRYSQRKVAKLFANSVDPDQTPHSAASDLGLHCLPITLLWVSRLQWVKVPNNIVADDSQFFFIIFFRENKKFHVNCLLDRLFI